MKTQMAVNFQNDQMVNSLALGREAKKKHLYVPQDSKSGNSKSLDLNPARM